MPLCPPGAGMASRARVGGKAGALVVTVAVRESVTLAGRAARARAARAFVVAVLGPGRVRG
jgi:hypothetical protein